MSSQSTPEHGCAWADPAFTLVPMNDIALRELREEDYPALAQILSDHWQETIAAEEVGRNLENIAPESIIQRLVAVKGGVLLGSSSVSHHPWRPEGFFFLQVIVDRALRGQGVGRVLARSALNFIQENGGTRVQTQVRDDDPAALAFAQRRGFTRKYHTFMSRLDVHSFDETPFAAAIERLEGQGLRFTTLAAEGLTDANKRALYELNRATALDVPDSEDTFLPYENFDRQVFQASWFDPPGQILALDGDRFVGLGALSVNATDHTGGNAFTGVDREYRGRGLATALKLLVVREAKRRGVTVIETGNNSLNAPILAINRKFGYQPLPGNYTLELQN